MDWLSFFDHLVGHLAWPVVIVFTILFFKSNIAGIVSRVVEILLPGGASVKLSPPIQSPDLAPTERRGLNEDDLLPTSLRGDPDLQPFIQEIEAPIRADLAALAPDRREAVLIRNLVFARLAHLAEVIYNSILGGQLRLLSRALQAGQAGLSLDEVREIYEEMMKARNWSDKEFPFSIFIGFLVTQRLIEQSGDGRYRITGLGRGFLKYLASVGRTLEKFP